MGTQDQTKTSAQKQTRERTQIEFPYTDMGQAEELTRTLYERGGGSAEPTQLAGWMDQSATGGSFRSRLSAARMFGFIETERSTVTITQLGQDVLQSATAPSARAAAFLRVPLFEAMYEKFNGYALPPAAAIERQVGELGVPTKQCERARQVFQKSATIAQFVDSSTGRFVKPASARPAADKSAEKNKDKKSYGGNGGGSDGGEITDKALEYKLVDLMKYDDVGDEERAAIWTLIQFLTRREKQKKDKKDNGGAE